MIRRRELLIAVQDIYPNISIQQFLYGPYFLPSEYPVTRPAEKPSKVIITAAWPFLEVPNSASTR